MGQITNLENTKKKDSRKNIYIDGEYICTLGEFSIFKHKLQVGSKITSEELQEIQIEDEVDTVFQNAVQVQTKNMKTTKQMQEYLFGLGCMEKTVQIVLAKLDEYKFINDEIYIKKYWNMHKSSRGLKRIQYELKLKGIEESLIDTVLADVDNQSKEVFDIALKYMKNKEKSYANFNKLVRYLVGKGFDMDQIGQVLQKLKVGDVNEDW